MFVPLNLTNKFTMTQKLICTAMLIACISLNSQTTYTSPSSGSASGGLSAWNGISWSASGSGSPVTYIIQSGFTFTINNSISFPGTDLQVIGTLLLNVGNNDLTMPSNGMISVANGGSIRGGNPSNQISIGSNVMSAPSGGGGFNISGPSFATSTTTGFNAFTLLPVKWENLKIERINDGVLLKGIASEIYNVHSFEIERSSDGIVFESVASILADQIQNTNQIEFKDLQAPKTKLFYRVKTIDNDASFTYSDLLSLNNEAKSTIVVFPTIFNADNASQITIQLDSDEDVMLLDMYGKSIVLQKNSSDDSNYNLPALKTGLYFIYLEGSKTSFHKILVR
jgi:hypothetical protein